MIRLRILHWAFATLLATAAVDNQSTSKEPSQPGATPNASSSPATEQVATFMAHVEVEAFRLMHDKLDPISVDAEAMERAAGSRDELVQALRKIGKVETVCRLDRTMDISRPFMVNHNYKIPYPMSASVTASGVIATQVTYQDKEIKFNFENIQLNRVARQFDARVATKIESEFKSSVQIAKDVRAPVFTNCKAMESMRFKLDQPKITVVSLGMANGNSDGVMVVRWRFTTEN